MNPELTVAYIDRGLAYNLLGNRQQAAADWRMAYKLDPSDKGLLQRMQRAGIRPDAPGSARRRVCSGRR